MAASAGNESRRGVSRVPGGVAANDFPAVRANREYRFDKRATGAAGQTNYAAAKAGLLALSQSLAKEVARLNITVNAVCPGYIQTEALSGMNDEQKKAAQAKVPMRRFRPAGRGGGGGAISGLFGSELHHRLGFESGRWYFITWKIELH